MSLFVSKAAAARGRTGRREAEVQAWSAPAARRSRAAPPCAAVGTQVAESEPVESPKPARGGRKKQLMEGAPQQ